MRMRLLGPIGPVSELSLGGGGIGQLWGKTTRGEAIATVRDALDAGITLLDMAPRYGEGEAEEVVGEAFGGRLPEGTKVTSKYLLGETPPAQVEQRLRQSIGESLARMRLERLDIFFLHSNVVPDQHEMRRHPDAATRMTPVSVFREVVRPVFEKFVGEGLVAAWGLTGIGHPDTIQALLGETPKPGAVQCISNLLDSPGGLKFFQGPAKPREIIRTAVENGIGVMGIRPVQAGALTDEIDRPLPDDHPEVRDYHLAEGFRRLAAELGESAAALAHRYALSMQSVDTVVLGIKNRRELDECVAGAEAGVLDPEIVSRIDASVRGAV